METYRVRDIGGAWKRLAEMPFIPALNPERLVLFAVPGQGGGCQQPNPACQPRRFGRRAVQDISRSTAISRAARFVRSGD